MTKKEPREILKTEPSKAISPLGTAERWFDDLERWFEEDLRRPFSSMKPLWWPRFRAAEHEGIMPTVDIFEEGDDVVLKTELPGMKKEDIDVSMTANSVTISGEKKHEEKVEKKNYYRMERSYGSFTRSFRLPAEVQTHKVKANFKDGVLEVRIPKTEEAKSKEKKIPIE